MSNPVEMRPVNGVRRWKREVVHMVPTSPGAASPVRSSVVASSGQEAAYMARAEGANRPKSKVRPAK